MKWSGAENTLAKQIFPENDWKERQMVYSTGITFRGILTVSKFSQD